ncbi:MAG: tyrosine-type recombinase/integrase [Spirochaetota bacterium]
MSRSKKLPEVLNEKEQQLLLEQPNPRYPTGQRNYTMIKLMLNTGLRLSETTNLKWKHIDLMVSKIMVREGKGAKDRTLPVGETIIDMLQDWRERQVEELQKRGINKKPEYVFTTLKGGQVSGRYVRKMVKRYANKAEINKDISPHTLRHTFATDYYRDTNNIRKVQKYLGHADISTTMIYTHIVDSDQEESIRNFHNKKNKVG